MRNDYYVRMGWADGYHGHDISTDELGRLTQSEIWDYEEGLEEGRRDFIIDEYGAPMEGYHEK